MWSRGEQIIFPPQTAVDRRKQGPPAAVSAAVSFPSSTCVNGAGPSHSTMKPVARLFISFAGVSAQTSAERSWLVPSGKPNFTSSQPDTRKKKKVMSVCNFRLHSVLFCGLFCPAGISLCILLLAIWQYDHTAPSFSGSASPEGFFFLFFFSEILRLWSQQRQTIYSPRP